jgi:hypothetical protein
LTWDHLLPESWYPETTPENIEKWKFPACRACNGAYGRLEEDLLYRLGLCVSQKDDASKGIQPKVVKALNSERGKNEKDKRARQRNKEKMLSQIVQLDPTPGMEFFPGFGPKPGQEGGPYTVVGLPHDALVKLTEKIVRGITYIVDKSFIEDDYVIEAYFVEERAAADVLYMIARYGTVYHRGPGILIQRAVTAEDPKTAMYAIEIWQRLKMCATVMSRVVHEEVEEEIKRQSEAEAAGLRSEQDV